MACSKQKKEVWMYTYHSYIALERIVDLRHRALRAGLPRSEAYFSGDTESSTIHFAAISASGHVVCCATMMISEYHGIPAWRLRGMATDERHRGLGIGGVLLAVSEQCVKHHPTHPAGFMWCDARASAVAFYKRNGWKVVSDVFEIETAGSHYKMIKFLG